MRLVWRQRVLEDLAQAAEWSQPQAAAVFDAMSHMAQAGWSLGRATRLPYIQYWPVEPLGVLYRTVGDDLIVVRVVDMRRLRRRP